VTAFELLGEIERRGAQVEVVESRLRIRPRAVVADLEREIRANADQLAAALRVQKADWRHVLTRWSQARHARWSARAACLEVYGGLAPSQADEQAFREVSAEPEPGTELVVRTVAASHFALALLAEPPACISLAPALASLAVADAAWNRGDDSGCQAAMRKLEEELGKLRDQGVTAWLVS
jgi:hypothetical protein